MKILSNRDLGKRVEAAPLSVGVHALACPLLSWGGIIPAHCRRQAAGGEGATTTASRGFTLVEMMCAVTVFSLLILATVALQIYAARVYTLAATKLSATAAAREALNDVRDKIRDGQLVYVGNYTLVTGNPIVDFQPIADGSNQEGNALMIYPSADNTNSFTLLFLQPSVATNFALSTPAATNSFILEIWTNGLLQESNDVADYITNQDAFEADDYTGAMLTNNINNRVFKVTMFFSQWEYPIAFIGTNEFNAYDYYRVQTRITRRLVD